MWSNFEVLTLNGSILRLLEVEHVLNIFCSENEIFGKEMTSSKEYLDHISAFERGQWQSIHCRMV